HPKTHAAIPEECLSYLRGFLSSRKLVVYNAQYECSVTYSQFDKLRIEPEDILAWVRCLNASGSLKEVAARGLGVSQWSDDVKDWIEAFAKFAESYSRLNRYKNSTFPDWAEKNGASFQSVIRFVMEESLKNATKALRPVDWSDQDITKTFTVGTTEANQ